MQNCLVELLSIDPPTAYQHAFVYVRQLAVHLRNAYASPQKDSQQAVYNWQFIHCLDLWAMLLGQRREEESLKPLLYPLIQTAVGTLSLQPSPKYYPLRLHCVRTLLELSEATGTFVPLASYLLEVRGGWFLASCIYFYVCMHGDGLGGREGEGSINLSTFWKCTV